MTAPGTIVDIGSGGGFPGLPLALPWSRDLDLVEATGRKCRFIARAVDRARQPNARAVCSARGGLGACRGRRPVRPGSARAVAPLATLVEYASPLLTEGGSTAAHHLVGRVLSVGAVPQVQRGSRT